MRYLLLLFLFVADTAAQPPRMRRQPVTDNPDTKPVSLSGVVLQSEASSLVIEATDHRVLTFKITRSTHLPSPSLKPGDGVHIEGQQDQEAYLTATDVTLDKSVAKSDTAEISAEPQRESTDPDRPKVARAAPVFAPAKPDPDDTGPPRLRHGQKNPPLAKPLPPDDLIVQARSEAPKIPDSVLKGAEDRPEPVRDTPKTEPDLLERAREWALSFTETLPNYVCQQFTTRYLKVPGQRDWQAKDVVSANVVYENGKEDYRNVAINGKPQSKKMEELPGSWSTGEFGTTLRSLFHRGRQAKFKYIKNSQISGMVASVYDYTVDRQHSDWRVQLGGQAIVPAYSGRVWIDQKTARVIRIEMQADDIPKDFPLDRVEAANDYGLVRLATADQFMLPLHAETLSCERGTTFCSRNTIEFRNYKKFSGDAVISFQE